jgi:hypothetical protein
MELVMSKLVDLGTVSSETKSTRINVFNQDSNKDLYTCFVDYTVASGKSDGFQKNLPVSDSALPSDIVDINQCTKQ